MTKEGRSFRKSILRELYMTQRRVPITIAMLVFVWLACHGCDPGYWLGVRADLKEPMSPQYIENTLRKLPRIDRVTVYTSESRHSYYLPEASVVRQPPDQYIFEAGDDKGMITQFQKEDGRTSFLAGLNGMGPPEEKMETMQVFNARIATQVARACHVTYVDDGRFICTPDRVRCREALGDQTSK
jgi:hypothetical protein